MPPLPLAKILDVALPSLAGEARGVGKGLVGKDGLLPPAGDVATFLGLRTRHQVARTLRRASLPPLEELAAWTRLFYWVFQSEQTGASLLALARQSRPEPETCYRLVRRLMGQPWSRVRRGGIAGAILRSRTIGGDTGMTKLVLQPYLVAAAHGEPRAAIAVGGAGVGSIFGVRAGRTAPLDHAEAAGRPRGVLASRLVIADYPFDVAIAPDGAAWLTRVHAAVLQRLQLQPLASTGAIRVGVAPTRVILAPSGARAWVTNQFTKDVAVVDLVSRCRAGSIAMEGDPLAAALSPDLRTLYVTTNFDRLCACALTDNGGRIPSSAPPPPTLTQIAGPPPPKPGFVPPSEARTNLPVDTRAPSV